MKRIPRRLAKQLTHQVACYCTFEHHQGAFGVRAHPDGEPWSVGQDLGGACAIASFILCRAIESRGYAAHVLYVPGHYFVLTMCGLLLDPTYMQFRKPMPRVVRVRGDGIKSFNDGPYRKLYTSDRVIGTIIEPERLIHAPGYRYPNWPGHYKPLMERVLRMMGVDGLE